MAQSKTYLLTDPAAIAQKVAAEGGPKIDPATPTGKDTADGVTLAWDIDGDHIEITVVSKPWILPYSVIWSHVAEVLGQPIG